jgi:hypothetical protein
MGSISPHSQRLKYRIARVSVEPRLEFGEQLAGVKQAHIAPGTDRTKIGDQWTFVAIDPETKLIPSYRVGKRTRSNAMAFMTDLSERLV